MQLSKMTPAILLCVAACGSSTTYPYADVERNILIPAGAGMLWIEYDGQWYQNAVSDDITVTWTPAESGKQGAIDVSVFATSLNPGTYSGQIAWMEQSPGLVQSGPTGPAAGEPLPNQIFGSYEFTLGADGSQGDLKVESTVLQPGGGGGDGPPMA